ncbi:hypothetical protein HZB04_01250 [Candidatus Wolfebacteria bacterium]|nr:hypothetical protein [Candidatus Wolfebacteria bacterium]
MAIFKLSKTNLIIPAIIFSFGLAASYSIIVSAQTAEIIYPVKDLGNCENETACRNFCDDQNNISACVAFAEKHDLISKEEAAKAKAFIQSGKIGPGNCSGKNECEAFCNDSANIEVCLSFAKNNGLMREYEIKEAEKFAKVLKEGAKPPGNCRGKNECENYCNNPDNMEECLAFAEKAEMIPKNELKEAKKALMAIKSGVKPPGNCRGKKECEAYCGEPSHMEECFAFAEKAGFIPPEEAAQARKMMPLMAAGKMPGGCRGKNECETYCADESHMDECANFALEAGLMKPKEAEMFKKTGGKGPGDCKGREQCEAFCNDPANQEACFNFAKEHNLIPPEEIEKMKGGMNQIKKGFEMAPPEVSQCLKSTVGEEILNKVQSGQMMPSQQLGGQMRDCFEKFMPQGGPDEGGFGPNGQNGQMPPAGMMPPQEAGFGGPGGCKTPEECQKFCSEHSQECAEFQKGFNKFEGILREKFDGQMPSREMMEIPRGDLPKGNFDKFKDAPNSGQMPSREMMEKMMKNGEIPESFNNGEIFNREGFNKQNIPSNIPKIPDQFKNMIPQNVLPQMPQQIPQMPDNKIPGITPLPVQPQYFQPTTEFQQIPGQ